jgi:hypothetical protein
VAPESVEVEMPLPDISGDPNALTPEVTKLVLKVVADLIKAKTDDGFSRLYELFVDKPDKRIFSDYYHIIETPIALKTIQANLKKGGTYRLLGDVERDFELICTNAKTYNEDSSPVYALSVTLRDEYLKRVAEAMEILKTPKKKPGKKKAAAVAEEGEGDEEDGSGPRKKRPRVSAGGGGKKRGRKSSTPSSSSALQSSMEDDGEEGEEDGDEEGHSEQEDGAKKGGGLKITLPSSYLKRGPNAAD